MDVLPDEPPFFGVVLGHYSYEVILYLKCSSQQLYVLDHLLALLLESF